MNTDCAIILAAGYGSRLQADEGHKLMATIGGEPMLAHHARNFARLGVDRLVVVTGFEGDVLADRVRRFRDRTPLTIDCVHNPDFDGQNGLSVLAGVDALEEDGQKAPFWLTMSDHLYDPGLFDDLETRFDDAVDDSTAGALLVDAKLETIYDMPDATKVRLQNSFEIGKKLEQFDVVDTGLFWCGTDFVQTLKQVRDDRGDCSTSDAVRRLRDRNQFQFVDIGDHLWQDIDTPGARNHAEKLWDDQFDD